MKHVNITSKDIVSSMTDEQKHILTLECMKSGTEPNEILSAMANITKKTINLGIDLCNDFFNTPMGKEYLEKRIAIEQIGMK